MTEAARKRSAKIRQDKASAENAKPVSPRLRRTTQKESQSSSSSIPRAKSLSSEKAKQAERKPPQKSQVTSSSAKKQKIDTTTAAPSASATMRPRSAKMSKTQETPAPLSDRSNRTVKSSTAVEPPKPVKKMMSSITANKLKEREEKEALKNQIAQLEADKLKLEELNSGLTQELCLARGEISSLSVIATIVMPNICIQKDRMAKRHQATLDKAAKELSNMAQQYALSELVLENKLVDEGQKSAQLESRITVQLNEVTQLKQATDELNKRLVDQAASMETMKREMAESVAHNEEIIESAVQERLKPWVNSKAEADSLRVEVEMKNDHLRKLRHSLNASQSDYGNIVLERDELIKTTHQKEEVDAKLENVRQENNQLKSEVGMLRYQLHSKSLALHDMSCSLDEEKYKNSITADRGSSFNAVYDELANVNAANEEEEQPSDEVFQ